MAYKTTISAEKWAIWAAKKLLKKSSKNFPTQGRCKV